MAKGRLVEDRITRNTIVESTLAPTTDKDGRKAKHGLIKYTQNNSGTIYEWEVREDSDTNQLSTLEVGKTYEVYLKAINSGRHTGYDWQIIKEVGKTPPKKAKPKTADDWIRSCYPDLILPPEKEPEPEVMPEAQPNRREEVLALLDRITQQDMNPDVKALVTLLIEGMAECEGLFA